MTDHMTEWRWLMRAAQIWLATGDVAFARDTVTKALRHANRLTPAHRRSTLRILNWLRTAERRTRCTPSPSC